jgi:hypothetical protein
MKTKISCDLPYFLAFILPGEYSIIQGTNHGVQYQNSGDVHNLPGAAGDKYVPSFEIVRHPEFLKRDSF